MKKGKYAMIGGTRQERATLGVFFGTPNGSTISVSEQDKIEIKLIEETAEK